MTRPTEATRRLPPSPCAARSEPSAVTATVTATVAAAESATAAASVAVAPAAITRPTPRPVTPSLCVGGHRPVSPGCRVQSRPVRQNTSIRQPGKWIRIPGHGIPRAEARCATGHWSQSHRTSSITCWHGNTSFLFRWFTSYHARQGLRNDLEPRRGFAASDNNSRSGNRASMLEEPLQQGRRSVGSRGCPMPRLHSTPRARSLRRPVRPLSTRSLRRPVRWGHGRVGAIPPVQARLARSHRTTADCPQRRTRVIRGLASWGSRFSSHSMTEQISCQLPRQKLGIKHHKLVTPCFATSYVNC